MRPRPGNVAEVMDLLADIDASCRRGALVLPQQGQLKQVWHGLVFSISGVRVVTAMREVQEMLTYPERITAVPGSKDWMLGLANVRGILLPVMDLQVFLGAKSVVRSKTARMLVVRLRGLECGVLVPSVQGMRHFDEAERMANARMKGAIGAYVYDAFSVDNTVWPVFSFSALAADPEFRIAAA